MSEYSDVMLPLTSTSSLRTTLPANEEEEVEERKMRHRIVIFLLPVCADNVDFVLSLERENTKKNALY